MGEINSTHDTAQHGTRAREQHDDKTPFALLRRLRCNVKLTDTTERDTSYSSRLCLLLALHIYRLSRSYYSSIPSYWTNLLDILILVPWIPPLPLHCCIYIWQSRPGRAAGRKPPLFLTQSLSLLICDLYRIVERNAAKYLLVAYSNYRGKQKKRPLPNHHFNFKYILHAQTLLLCSSRLKGWYWQFNTKYMGMTRRTAPYILTL
jgi:hypothetical protein